MSQIEKLGLPVTQFLFVIDLQYVPVGIYFRWGYRLFNSVSTFKMAAKQGR